MDVAVSESYLVRKGLANLTTFLSIAFLIFLILYLLLGQIFKNYRRQVLDLVDTMNLISQGEKMCIRDRCHLGLLGLLSR